MYISTTLTPTPGLTTSLHRLKDVVIQSKVTPDTYISSFEHFSNIKKSDLHIITNTDAKIGPAVATEILFTMHLSKQIILLTPPKFSKNIDLFAREAIESRLNKFLLCDITQLDYEDLEPFLHSLCGQKNNFSFTKHESALIKARVRAYFRALS